MIQGELIQNGQINCSRHVAEFNENKHVSKYYLIKDYCRAVFGSVVIFDDYYTNLI